MWRLRAARTKRARPRYIWNVSIAAHEDDRPAGEPVRLGIARQDPGPAVRRVSWEEIQEQAERAADIGPQVRAELRAAFPERGGAEGPLVSHRGRRARKEARAERDRATRAA